MSFCTQTEKVFVLLMKKLRKLEFRIFACCDDRRSSAPSLLAILSGVLFGYFGLLLVFIFFWISLDFLWGLVSLFALFASGDSSSEPVEQAPPDVVCLLDAISEPF